ncbi:MAG TPA: M14 metallopeptidase family protein [Bryobacteraceae bacterium]
MRRCDSAITRSCLAACFFLVPAFAAVPTPESWFGHPIGVDRQLLDWDKVISYFQALARSSDKIRVAEYGRSAEGRPMIVATIAAPETLRKLDRYREIQRRLADPRITSPAQAEAMFREGKNIVLMTCSIHANEVASTHSAVEFAWRLITENNPRFQTILDNTILLLVPSLNPDGVDIVTRWYRSTLGTKFEGTNPPELWHKYVGHDNNRDWYILSQPETRATISQLHNVWHPEIVYDVHQQGSYASRMFIPPWLDPAEPNIDPILLQEMNALGTSMAADLTAAGKPGIAIHAAYDFWSPSRHYQAFHGGLRMLTESASALLATPLMVAPDQIDENALGYKPREKSWNYLEPWLGGVWKLRDIIDDQELAFESLLHNAAVNREEMLRNFYKVGQHQIERTSPVEIVISRNQRDPGATRRMLSTLAAGAVEIMQNGAGDYVIPMKQPYSGYAKALMERQHYPNILLYPGGPPQRPYDVTAHTLPLLFGVDVKFVERAEPARLTSADLREPSPRDIYKASDTDAWKAANIWWAAGKTVWRNEAGDFAAVAQGPGWQEVKRPRVGLYQSWMANIDEGWTRWLLEQFGFAYTTLHNADIQGGNLRARFDTIVFADEQPGAIENGHAPGSLPQEFTGGVGAKGADAIREFVRGGGTAVFLNRSSEYGAEKFGVKGKNVTAGVPAQEFYSPGSLLNVKLDLHDPLTRGLPEAITIWSEGSPAWSVEGEESVAKYPDSNVLASGWLLGEKRITGKTALIRSRYGAGNVILFGMRPQYRAQSYLTFKLFFNALSAN